ncbi:MAG: alkaline phosphatase D family protein, partial [Planctomycetota bacterium]
MKTVWSLAAIVCLAGSAWAQSESRSTAIERIAFGSCLHQDKPQPIWDAVAAVEPQVFLMIGDAVYADTTDPEELRRFYSQVDQNPAWKKLREDCRVLMTWDDHDYGLNDGGAEHPNREGAQAAFLDFAGEPADSPRRARAGVYASAVLGPPGKRVQIIMLDTRYHRSPLQRVTVGSNTTVLPTVDTEATILGEAQWSWLEKQFLVEAELRLVVSSIQVLND